jgi:hypothetical protein
MFYTLLLALSVKREWWNMDLEHGIFYLYRHWLFESLAVLQIGLYIIVEATDDGMVKLSAFDCAWKSAVSSISLRVEAVIGKQADIRGCFTLSVD